MQSFCKKKKRVPSKTSARCDSFKYIQDGSNVHLVYFNDFNRFNQSGALNLSSKKNHRSTWTALDMRQIGYREREKIAK